MQPDFDKKRVAAGFDQAANDYDAHAVLQRTVVERLVERLDLVTIRPGRILDIGSGTGEGARLLADKYRYADLLQLDLSPEMLKVSRAKRRGFLQGLFSRQSYLAGDAEYLPVSNAAVDLVFSSLTLQWCNDLDRAFTETTRVLRPGGLFMFATLGPDTLTELRQSWMAADDRIHVNRFLDMHDIGDALVRAGMESVVMDVETITLTYDECRQLMRDLKTLGAQNRNPERSSGLTGKKQLEKVICAYEEFRQDGKLPATYEIVYGHGWLPAAGITKKQGGTAYVPIENLRRGKD
ncbi:MAG TPA: malonyl-ACP O-methyltransferase BioC [Gammaproteobacteria bacterium]|nr:malonyl-ACP O-methyltransferase BioC [Gammaproteobacteria bacterium]